MEFPLFAGILAAVLHVISGPDHLAAVTPFAIESKRKAWKIGATWGLAHLMGMLLVGMLFMWFRDRIPVEAISAHSEQLVGLVLVLVGLWTLFSVFRRSRKHSHLHIHLNGKPYIHKHRHVHEEASEARQVEGSLSTADQLAGQIEGRGSDKRGEAPPGNHGHTHSKTPANRELATFSIGLLHGLAGIAHFLLFLPVLGFENREDSVAYIGGFGIGTVLAMVIFTLVLGRISELAGNWHHPLFFKGIRIAGGLFALIIGVYWMLVN